MATIKLTDQLGFNVADRSAYYNQLALQTLLGSI